MSRAFCAVAAALLIAVSTANADTISALNLTVNPGAGAVTDGTGPVPIYADFGSDQSFVTTGFANTFTYSGTFAPITITQQCCGNNSFLDVAINFTAPLSVPIPSPPSGAFWRSQIVTLTLFGPNIPPWNPTSFNYGGINLLANQIQPFEGGAFAGVGGALVASNSPINFGPNVPIPISELSANYFLLGNLPSSSLTVDQFSLTVQEVGTTPLPSTWGMMFLGLGFFGLLVYRRTRTYGSLASPI